MLATPICDSTANPSIVPTPDEPWRQRREWWRSHVTDRPGASVGLEELEAHFALMPAHYWEQVNEADLVWGLETIHDFLKLVASPHHAATAPVVSWRPGQQPCAMRVLLCTWDRHGLLAKAAAAFSAVRLNIVHAAIYTRADNIVLDQFLVTAAGARAAVDEARLREMTFLLEGALSEPPRFASIWACSRHKFLAPASLERPQITCDNAASTDSTVVHVEAADRLGLLYDILQALADMGLNIKQARIETAGARAQDSIHVTDALGRKMDPAQFASLRERLEAALTVSG